MINTPVAPDGFATRSPQTVGSPEWHRDRLLRRLEQRQHALDTLQAYYDGDHPLAFASAKFREAFGGLFREFADNFAPLVVEAVMERLTVTGFRWTKDVDPRTGAIPADGKAWTIWQRNRLDAYSELAHQEALVKGEGAAIVWYDPKDRDLAQVTIEDGSLVVVDSVPGRPLDRRAALKRWIDDDGYVKATLYLPDGIWKWQSARPYQPGSQVRDWRQRQPKGEAWPLPNPLGVVPVVPFHNRPRLRVGPDGMVGRSEIANVIPLQDAINKEVADMLVSSEFAAYRQRYALNLDLETDPTTGQPRVPFKIGHDRMLIVGNPDPENPNAKEVRFGEFQVSDLAPYISAIEMLVQHVATQTRTPAHYLLGQSGNFPSGESLKATETGLVAKVRQRMRHTGESWEEVLRLAFAVEGDSARADVMDAETIWADPESRTEAEHTDAVVKMGSAPINIPQVVLWEELGFTPQQIERMEAMVARAQLAAAMAGDPLTGVGTLGQPDAPPQPVQGAQPRPSSAPAGNVMPGNPRRPQQRTQDAAQPAIPGR